MNDFKPGDLVALKAGGPLMKVKHVSTNGARLVAVDWHEAGKLKQGIYPSVSLAKAQDGK